LLSINEVQWIPDFSKRSRTENSRSLSYSQVAIVKLLHQGTCIKKTITPEQVAESEIIVNFEAGVESSSELRPRHEVCGGRADPESEQGEGH
jgi:hypothetical protein